MLENKKVILIFLLLHFLFNFTYAEVSDIQGAYIDTVYSFKAGSGQNSGQSPQYYPKNIFGKPTEESDIYIPASAETDVLSIGLGGEIIIGLKDKFIVNGKGNDFIIFENAFKNKATEKIFAEPAVISVSEDGINFIEFPYDNWTLEGCAGKTPTIGSKNPFLDEDCGGDAFDLEKIGLNRVKYIKIKDISSVVSQDENHPYYTIEALVTGFDLDAVACLHTREYTTNISNSDNSSLIIIGDFIKVPVNKSFNLEIYDYLGSKVKSFTNQTNEICDISDIKKGAYFAVCVSENELFSKVFIKL